MATRTPRKPPVPGAKSVDGLEASDRSLLIRFCRGEDDAATALYRRYAQRLEAFAQRQTSHQFASRFDPEDVIQSVFRTFFRRAHEGGVAIPAGEEIWQLLLVIALNKVRRMGRYHRQQRRDVQQTVGFESLPTAAQPAGDPSLIALQWVVDDALADCPPAHRTMIEMRIQGYAIREIARAARRSRRTVERVLRQFRDDLATYLDTPGSHVDI